ncbi:hypothetical protein N7462_002981 [Penicillium macrosclerotiorum]|uniref:uncharacterized protein n=1 Tax=Penicillium macrosclerotiorum TaxID=303699 RepID=UPI0025489E81|nr:uncharacterized protein N7462_002981 [Penicillium macrosclerotiorum]KAJ5688589.1 hypothetical protein N7462_002981 [Penicillium macrosclerotiorum]
MNKLRKDFYKQPVRQPSTPGKLSERTWFPFQGGLRGSCETAIVSRARVQCTGKQTASLWSAAGAY